MFRGDQTAKYVAGRECGTGPECCEDGSFMDLPSYVGNGRGSYRQETAYRYVGHGAGEFDLVEVPTLSPTRFRLLLGGCLPAFITPCILGGLVHLLVRATGAAG